MRTIALFLVAGICIASAVIAQEEDVPFQPPIDLSLEAPALLAVGMVPDSDVFFYLEFRTVPDADSYIVWGKGREDEGMAGLLIHWGTFDAPSGEDADALTVILYAPKGAAERLWGVSARIGDVQTPLALLAWGRLPMGPTAVRSTSWAAVKADH